MITELIQYITPQGDEINLNTPPYRGVYNITGLGRPPINTYNIRSAYQHGDDLVSYRLDPRTIGMNLAYRGQSRSDWWSNREHLLLRLGNQNMAPNLPELGTLRFCYIQDDTYITRDIDCYLSDGLNYDSTIRWHEWGISERLQFIAPDPVWYDPTEITVTVDTFDSHLILPFEFPFLLGTGEATENITYDGTWLTYPIIEIDGPTQGIYIENETLDTILRLDYFIQAGITVTIDTSFGNKSVTDSLGNNLVAYLINSDIAEFALEADPHATGGVNVIKIQTVDEADTTEVRFKYYTRYYGI